MLAYHAWPAVPLQDWAHWARPASVFSLLKEALVIVLCKTRRRPNRPEHGHVQGFPGRRSPAYLQAQMTYELFHVVELANQVLEPTLGA